MMAAVTVWAAGAAVPAAAQGPRQGAGAHPGDLTPAEATPAALRDVGFDQRLGETVPLDLPFTDAEGRPVVLGDYFGQRPVILSLVYFECPMLCPMTLAGLTSSLKPLELDAGDVFDVVVVSFNPAEGPELAAKAKLEAVHRYGRAGAETGWHFLTGGEDAIRRLTEAVGFRYTWDPERQQFAHAAGVVVLTPSGRIARYFFGIEYPARDLKLGLMEAAEQRIGSPVDQLLLYCFHYDPETGQYAWSGTAIAALRVAAVLTLLALGSFVFLMVRQERRKNRHGRPEDHLEHHRSETRAAKHA
jgi:protein SCO1/2